LLCLYLLNPLINIKEITRPGFRCHHSSGRKWYQFRIQKTKSASHQNEEQIECNLLVE
jgi:hypothetical protein